ncbi:hypothetical protein [Nocardioides sp.]|uniref:hypothetical protein n=1 Tax=Nocardioides sp. TaxID=35761 RepID=UPI0039E6053A
MELAPVPRRQSVVLALWRVVAVALLAPLILLVLLPAVLGLSRFVVTTDAMASVPRGSLVFSRYVPGSDLHGGDVITFRQPLPAPDDGFVTRRVTSVHGDQLQTGSDAGADSWVLSVSDQSYARMVAHVPWAGYPFVGNTDRWAWAPLVGIPVMALLLSFAAGHRRRGTREPADQLI